MSSNGRSNSQGSSLPRWFRSFGNKIGTHLENFYTSASDTVESISLPPSFSNRVEPATCPADPLTGLPRPLPAVPSIASQKHSFIRSYLVCLMAEISVLTVLEFDGSVLLGTTNGLYALLKQTIKEHCSNCPLYPLLLIPNVEIRKIVLDEVTKTVLMLASGQLRAYSSETISQLLQLAQGWVKSTTGKKVLRKQRSMDPLEPTARGIKKNSFMDSRRSIERLRLGEEDSAKRCMLNDKERSLLDSVWAHDYKVANGATKNCVSMSVAYHSMEGLHILVVLKQRSILLYCYNNGFLLKKSLWTPANPHQVSLNSVQVLGCRVNLGCPDHLQILLSYKHRGKTETVPTIEWNRINATFGTVQDIYPLLTRLLPGGESQRRHLGSLVNVTYLKETPGSWHANAASVLLATFEHGIMRVNQETDHSNSYLVLLDRDGWPRDDAWEIDGIRWVIAIPKARRVLAASTMGVALKEYDTGATVAGFMGNDLCFPQQELSTSGSSVVWLTERNTEGSADRNRFWLHALDCEKSYDDFPRCSRGLLAPPAAGSHTVPHDCE